MSDCTDMNADLITNTNMPAPDSEQAKRPTSDGIDYWMDRATEAEEKVAALQKHIEKETVPRSFSITQQDTIAAFHKQVEELRLALFDALARTGTCFMCGAEDDDELPAQHSSTCALAATPSPAEGER